MAWEFAGRPLRILVAEDEPLAALVIEEALTDFGHEVHLAPDGLAALELAEREGPFDVLVTDLAMPRLPGWELIPRLRAAHPELPVVVMTGFLPPEIGDELRHDTAAHMELLLKPFDLMALAGALERVSALAKAA